MMRLIWSKKEIRLHELFLIRLFVSSGGLINELEEELEPGFHTTGVHVCVCTQYNGMSDESNASNILTGQTVTATGRHQALRSGG